MKFIRYILLIFITITSIKTSAQINTDQVMRIGRNALYFEDYMLSIQYFNQVIQAKPYLAQPYFYRAIAKLSLEDYIGAEEDATTAIEHNPFITDAYEVRGVARQNLGRNREAIEDYDKALSMLPENRGIMFNRAMAQEEIKDYENAAKSYDDLLRAHPGFDNGYIGRARLRLITGDTINAITDVNRAIEINRNATNAYVLRADIAIKTAKDYRQALDDMNEAIKLQPQYAGFFINRAFLRYNLDDYFGAMADYDYAIQLEPLNTVALFNRGLLRAEVNDNNKAIDDFSKVLSLNNNDYRALYNRAMLYRDIHEYKKAIADIDRVIEAYPSFSGAHFLRYEINRQSGNMAQAEKDYNKSMTLAKKATPKTEGSDNNETSTDNETEPQEIIANRFTSLLTIENETTPEQEFNNKSIRGKVQDRNMNIEAEPMFALTYYTSPTELKESTYYLKEIDEINSTRLLRFMLMITNHESQLNDEGDIRHHFESIEYYNSYISTHQPRAIDFFARAMDFVTIHNYRAAIADFNRAIELTPDFALAYLMRAVTKQKYFEVEKLQGDNNGETNAMTAQLNAQKARVIYSEIISDLDHVTRISPQMALAHYNKGCVLIAMQDYTSALASFTNAINIKPDLGEAYYNRGYVYLKLGNKTSGLADLSKAGELGIIPSYNLLKRMTR